MKRKHVLMSLALLVMCSFVCLADRVMDRSETLQLFEQLTNQPKKAWIAAGRIEGSHEEYRAAKTTDENQIKARILQDVAAYQANTNKLEKADFLQKLQLDATPFNTRYDLSNEYTMSSIESVSYDGQRFYWDISIQARTDSIKPDRTLEGNYMTNQFDTKLNSRKIMAWDGEKYTKYSPMAEHAFVDSAGELPHNVNGPLTAGLIPWGYGYYSYDNMAALQSEAIESVVDGNTQIQLTLTNSDGSQISVLLDPAKEYAMLSCSITGRGSAVISKQYFDYQNVAGYWIPMSILLEKYDAESQRLLARDTWAITSVDANFPSDDSFKVNYEEDTLIEYTSPLTDRPLLYRHSSVVDTDIVLGKKLVYDTEEGSQPQNCATAALKYALEQLGVSADDSQLADLVSEPNNSTNLYDMKSFAQNLGLNCRAIKADLDTIRDLSNCQIILYLPGRKHFVVLESIDSDHVRLIDMASRKFYDRIDISFFDMDWPTGVALVISNNIIQGDLVDIAENELVDIVGASGYSCTKLIQQYKYTLCQYVAEECLGYVTIYWERWGCEAAESGSCSYSWFTRLSRTPCIEDIYDPFSCTITGDWTDYWMRACS